MAESRILEILTRNKGDSTDISESSCFPKLSPHCVRWISKIITDALYGSLTTTSTLQGNKRLDILLLLQKWCTNSGSHFKIDCNNYDCLIDFLISTVVTDDDLQIKIELSKEFDEICKLNVTASVTKHYRKMEVINTEKTKLSEVIRRRDYEKLGNDSVFDPNSSSSFKNIELLNSVYELEVLNDQQCCEVLTDTKILNNCKQSMALRTSPSSIREKQIGLAYSLLNLNKSSNDMLLLSIIIKNLSAYEKLQLYEIEFINYLWQKSVEVDLQAEISLLLLENFSFIYERGLIGICKDALRANSSHNMPHISQDVPKILQLSLESERLRCNIRNLFYELYACSGYSNRKVGIIVSENYREKIMQVTNLKFC